MNKFVAALNIKFFAFGCLMTSFVGMTLFLCMTSLVLVIILEQM